MRKQTAEACSKTPAEEMIIAEFFGDANLILVD